MTATSKLTSEWDDGIGILLMSGINSLSKFKNWDHRKRCEMVKS